MTLEYKPKFIDNGYDAFPKHKTPCPDCGKPIIRMSHHRKKMHSDILDRKRY